MREKLDRSPRAKLTAGSCPGSEGSARYRWPRSWCPLQFDFCGQYRAAKGRNLRGKLAPFITYGYSKDHRPDLKQLLFIMTTSADGGVPVQFRCEAGNCSDSRTHEETWDALRDITGDTRFLYVAPVPHTPRTDPPDILHLLDFFQKKAG
jgi:hypothetical protein